MNGAAGIIWAATPQPEAMRDGSCIGTDPEVFFAIGNTSTGAAKRICRGCPAKIACLTWAIDNGVGYGVWGGLDADQRDDLRRNARIATVCQHCDRNFLGLPGRQYCSRACAGANAVAASRAKQAARGAANAERLGLAVAA